MPHAHTRAVHAHTRFTTRTRRDTDAHADLLSEVIHLARLHIFRNTHTHTHIHPHTHTYLVSEVIDVERLELRKGPRHVL